MSRHSWRAAGSRFLSIRVPRRVCMRRARALLPLIDGKTRIPSGPGSTHNDDMYGVEIRIEWALEQEESPRLISGHEGTRRNILPLFHSVKIRNAWRWFSLSLANISEHAKSAHCYSYPTKLPKSSVEVQYQDQQRRPDDPPTFSPSGRAFSLMLDGIYRSASLFSTTRYRV
jgi:hypothetical protein